MKTLLVVVMSLVLASSTTAHPIYPCHLSPGTCPGPDDHSAISHVEADLQAAIHSFEQAFGTPAEAAEAEKLMRLLEQRLKRN